MKLYDTDVDQFWMLDNLLFFFITIWMEMAESIIHSTALHSAKLSRTLEKMGLIIFMIEFRIEISADIYIHCCSAEPLVYYCFLISSESQFVCIFFHFPAFRTHNATSLDDKLSRARRVWSCSILYSCINVYRSRWMDSTRYIHIKTVKSGKKIVAQCW